MNAQELRPGNWVLVNGAPNVIWAAGIAALENGRLTADPIQLTGAMVKALGLREGRWKIDDGAERVSYHAGDLMLLDDWTTGLQIAEHFYIVGQRPYLHQLQNFYHAITGNEIRITL